LRIWRYKARELTTNEIEVIITNFVKAALRGKKANFDGIEVHAAHGYLLAQFLSSAWNNGRMTSGGILRIKLECSQR